MREVLKESDESCDLLDKWFLLDRNFLPPCYTLQPIGTFFPHFSDPSDPKAQEKDRYEWGAVLRQLQLQLRRAALILQGRGELSNSKAERFVISGWSLLSFTISFSTFSYPVCLSQSLTNYLIYVNKSHTRKSLMESSIKVRQTRKNPCVFFAPSRAQELLLNPLHTSTCNGRTRLYLMKRQPEC